MTLLSFKDLLVLVIFFYLFIQITVSIYQTLCQTTSTTGEDKEEVTNANHSLEKFQSLTKINNDLYLVFPGKAEQTIYRNATMTTDMADLVYYFTSPLIKYLNEQEQCQFSLGNIIYVIAQEYQEGSIYTMEVVLLDTNQPISIILKMEIVVNSDGLMHINYVKVVNHTINATNQDYLNTPTGPKNVKDLKKTILPIPS